LGLIMWGHILPRNWERDHTNLPAQHTQDQIEHEEASNHDQRNEKNPIEGASDSIVGLKIGK
jgi:hypothetical protein